MTVAITHGSAGSSNPISETLIYRQTLAPGGSDIVNPFVDPYEYKRVATLTGKVTSWKDTNTRSNRKYTYRVATRNTKGASEVKTSNSVYSYPGAPTIIARRTGTSSVVVDHLNSLSTGTTASRFDVYDGATLIATNQAFPYTHASSSNAVSHSYKAKALITFAQGSGGSVTYYGGTSNTSTVPLGQAPDKPTLLGPVNATVPSGAVPFTWQHNPVDTTDQTAYELRYRIGAGSWTVLSGTTAQFRSVTLTVGVYEWQVRTKGANATFSLWSDSGFVTVATIPTVTITSPTTTHTSTDVAAAWTYAQAESLPQTEWVARLKLGGVVLEEGSAVDASTSHQFITKLTNATAYSIEVQVAVGDAWSTLATKSFTTAVAAPPAPSISGSWSEAFGVNTVTAVAAAGSPATVALSVDRSVNGGEWEQVSIPNGLLVEGENVIAASVHSNYRTTPSHSFELVAAVTERGAAPGDPDIVTTKIPAASSWRYVYANAGPVGDWTAIAYDDDLWASGTAPLGWGQPILGTTLTSAETPKPLVSFYRRTFVMGDVSDVIGITLTTRADDGIIVYVNGVEVTRVNVDPGPDGPAVTANISVVAADAIAHPVIVEQGTGVTSFEVQDGLCLSNGVTQYRVTAYTALGGDTSTVIGVNATSDSVWLSGGEDFLDTARLPVNPTVEFESGRERSLVQYDGRPDPVAYAGKAKTRRVSVSGDTHADQQSAVMADLERLAQAPEPLHLIRDPEGRRITGVLSPIRQPRNPIPGWWSYAFTLTEATE